MRYRLITILLVLFVFTGCTTESDGFLLPPFEPVSDTIPLPSDTAPKDAVAEFVFPDKVDLAVPWGSQAPTGDWGLPYQEACEEAVLIGSHYYLTGEKLNESLMNEEIKNLIAWETEKYGTYTDTTIAEVAQMAREYFNLNAEISEDVSVTNIKKQLASGKLVIVPTAGRLLGNPHYTGAGPIYHMLILRGYNSKYFITNDVGTRNSGFGYKFKINTVIEAIHDLPLKEDGSAWRFYDETIPDAEKAERMLTGVKKILILTK